MLDQSNLGPRVSPLITGKRFSLVNRQLIRFRHSFLWLRRRKGTIHYYADDCFHSKYSQTTIHAYVLKLPPIFRIQTFLNYILASPLRKLKISRVAWLFKSLIFGLLEVGVKGLCNNYQEWGEGWKTRRGGITENCCQERGLKVKSLIWRRGDLKFYSKCK